MTVTIGVAIAVPEPHGSMLREKRAEYGDPMAETVPSHVTLMPPTVILKEELEGVCEALETAATAMAQFGMRLRGTGTFRPISPVVFVAVSQGISYTEVLASAVRARLDAPEPEFPFHPHVTVAHHLPDDVLDRAYEDLATFECAFRVEEFALYVQDDRQGWLPYRRFGLVS